MVSLAAPALTISKVGSGIFLFGDFDCFGFLGDDFNNLRFWCGTFTIFSEIEQLILYYETGEFFVYCSWDLKKLHFYLLN